MVGPMLKANFYNLMFFIFLSFIAEGMECDEIDNSSGTIQIKTGFNSIKDFKFSEDGTRLAVIGHDSPIAEIWDVINNKLIYKLKDTEPITAATLFSNINLIITVNTNKQTNYWSTHTGEWLESANIEQIFGINKNNFYISHMFFQDFYKAAFVLNTGQTQILKFFYNLSIDGSDFQYILEDTEQLDSAILHDQYVFLRLKNNLDNNEICKLFKMKKNGKVRDACTDQYFAYDFCRGTNKLLISPTNKELMPISEQNLYELNFATPEKEKIISIVAKFSSRIKSAVYNPEGNRILVITEENLPQIFTKIEDKWEFTQSIPLTDIHILRQSNNWIAFAKPNNNIISLFKCA
jgi:WD40 repeat protein